MNIKPLLKGITSYVPVLYNAITTAGTGGTTSARYCYSVWLRHLIMAHKNNLSTQADVIAELGPGDSLGVGLAALISGANKYYALDVLRYADNKRNIEILDELAELFKEREKIPDEAEFPRVKPNLKSYEFPTHILTDERLDKALNASRIASIRKALLNPNCRTDSNIQISYFAPWYDSQIMKENAVDMIYSQAVLEHVDDIVSTYHNLCRWLKPGGLMSHTIDFKCHGNAKQWNGHWGYSDVLWNLIKGKRAYLINRFPYSTHLELMSRFGFEVVCEVKYKKDSTIQRKHLARRFKNISDDDLTTSDVFIQTVKKRDMD